MGTSLASLALATLSYVQQYRTNGRAEQRLSSFARHLQGLRAQAGEPPLAAIKADLKLVCPGRPDLPKSITAVLDGQQYPSADFVNAFVEACHALALKREIQISHPYSELQWWHRERMQLQIPLPIGVRFLALMVSGAALTLLTVAVVTIPQESRLEKIRHAVQIEQVTIPSTASYYRIRAVLRNESDREELINKISLEMLFRLGSMCSPWSIEYRIRGEMAFRGRSNGQYDLVGEVDENLDEEEIFHDRPSEAPVLTQPLRGNLQFKGCGRSDMELEFDSTVRIPGNALVVMSIDMPERMHGGPVSISTRTLKGVSIMAHMANPSAIVKSCFDVHSVKSKSGISVTRRTC